MHGDYNGICRRYEYELSKLCHKSSLLCRVHDEGIQDSGLSGQCLDIWCQGLHSRSIVIRAYMGCVRIAIRQQKNPQGVMFQ